MTELVVVSGKGGTGKTSIVGSLAVLARKAVLVDCDVDAADLHLILGHELKEVTEFVSGARASIDKDRCMSCGVCLDYCRFDAVRHEPDENSIAGERFWIDRYACDGCGACSRLCPVEAIDFKETVSGKWFLSDTSHGPLIHGRLGIAQSNSGKLVSLLRGKSRCVAEEKGLDLIIVDGPPGIGCPVMASITGASFLLVVTEPSLSAFHDMERLLDLARHFRVRSGLCINKHDINPELTVKMEDFARDREIELLGRIAYDPSFTRSQIAGTTLVEYTHSSVSGQVESLWVNLQNELQAVEYKKTESKV